MRKVFVEMAEKAKNLKRIAHNSNLYFNEKNEGMDYLQDILKDMDTTLSNFSDSTNFKIVSRCANNVKSVPVPIEDETEFSIHGTKTTKSMLPNRHFPLMAKCQRSLKYLRHNQCIPKPRAHINKILKSPMKISQKNKISSKLKINKTILPHQNEIYKLGQKTTSVAIKKSNSKPECSSVKNNLLAKQKHVSKCIDSDPKPSILASKQTEASKDRVAYQLPKSQGGKSTESIRSHESKKDSKKIEKVSSKVSTVKKSHVKSDDDSKKNCEKSKAKNKTYSSECSDRGSDYEFEKFINKHKAHKRKIKVLSTDEESESDERKVKCRKKAKKVKKFLSDVSNVKKVSTKKEEIIRVTENKSDLDDESSDSLFNCNENYYCDSGSDSKDDLKNSVSEKNLTESFKLESKAENLKAHLKKCAVLLQKDSNIDEKAKSSELSPEDMSNESKVVDSSSDKEKSSFEGREKTCSLEENEKTCSLEENVKPEIKNIKTVIELSDDEDITNANSFISVEVPKILPEEFSNSGKSHVDLSQLQISNESQDSDVEIIDLDTPEKTSVDCSSHIKQNENVSLTSHLSCENNLDLSQEKLFLNPSDVLNIDQKPDKNSLTKICSEVEKHISANSIDLSENQGRVSALPNNHDTKALRINSCVEQNYNLVNINKKLCNGKGQNRTLESIAIKTEISTSGNNAANSNCLSKQIEDDCIILDAIESSMNRKSLNDTQVKKNCLSDSPSNCTEVHLPINIKPDYSSSLKTGYINGSAAIQNGLIKPKNAVNLENDDDCVILNDVLSENPLVDEKTKNVSQNLPSQNFNDNNYYQTFINAKLLQSNEVLNSVNETLNSLEFKKDAIVKEENLDQMKKETIVQHIQSPNKKVTVPISNVKSEVQEVITVLDDDILENNLNVPKVKEKLDYKTPNSYENNHIKEKQIQALSLDHPSKNIPCCSPLPISSSSEFSCNCDIQSKNAECQNVKHNGKETKILQSSSICHRQSEQEIYLRDAFEGCGKSITKTSVRDFQESKNIFSFFPPSQSTPENTLLPLINLYEKESSIYQNLINIMENVGSDIKSLVDHQSEKLKHLEFSIKNIAQHDPCFHKVWAKFYSGSKRNQGPNLNQAVKMASVTIKEEKKCSNSENNAEFSNSSVQSPVILNNHCDESSEDESKQAQILFQKHNSENFKQTQNLAVFHEQSSKVIKKEPSSDYSVQQETDFESNKIDIKNEIEELDAVPTVQENDYRAMQAEAKKYLETSKCVVCYRPAKGACSHCYKVYYCSEECSESPMGVMHSETCTKRRF